MPAGQFLLSLRAGPLEPRIGEILVVEILARTPERVLDAPLHLAYDPAILRFLDASPGPFLSQDGVNVVFLVNGHTNPGDVAIGIGRTDRSRGIAGAGILCSVRFVAAAPGDTSMSVAQAMAWTETRALLQVTHHAVEVSVR